MTLKCRVPVAVGAIHAQGFSSPIQQSACAESLGNIGNNATDNNMRLIGSKGCLGSVLHLAAKPMPQPKKEPTPNLCYSVHWQVQFLI